MHLKVRITLKIVFKSCINIYLAYIHYTVQVFFISSKYFFYRTTLIEQIIFYIEHLNFSVSSILNLLRTYFLYNWKIRFIFFQRKQIRYYVFQNVFWLNIMKCALKMIKTEEKWCHKHFFIHLLRQELDYWSDSSRWKWMTGGKNCWWTQKKI